MPIVVVGIMPCEEPQAIFEEKLTYKVMHF